MFDEIVLGVAKKSVSLSPIEMRFIKVICNNNPCYTKYFDEADIERFYLPHMRRSINDKLEHACVKKRVKCERVKDRTTYKWEIVDV